MSVVPGLPVPVNSAQNSEMIGRATTFPIPPISLLREQALRWEQETGGILRGLISTESGSNASMVHSLFIEAPRLDNFRYRIVSVMHNIFPLYPAHVIYDAATGYEFDSTRPDRYSIDNALKRRVEDSERLKDVLRQIFDSEEIQNIAASLVAQSEMPVAA